MKERTKEVLRDGFGVLVNNAAAIRGAKNGPLWLTIVFFVLSLFLPVLPIFIAQINVNGSTFLNRYSYGLEKTITAMAIDLKDNHNVEFDLGVDHLLTIKEDGNAIAYSTYGAEKPFAAYENDATKQYDFMLYASDVMTANEKKMVNTAIAAKTYKLGTKDASSEKEGIYTPSYMIVFKDSFYIAIYGNNTTKIITSSYTGDYKTMKATTTGLKELLTVTDKDGNAVAQNILNDDYTNGVLKNFKKVLDKSYESSKVVNVWGTSGIYLAIFFGLSVVMGFLMWILTRGKNNPNNYFTPWLTQKIEARLALSPAIITLIAGFFLVNQAPLIFILTLGLRVMWISMKELRPQQA
ncbi:MAG: hypothetical protein J6I84_00695 [Bacilli bacterium]|nr:hypothetical protein [Bacilli bacterium]